MKVLLVNKYNFIKGGADKYFLDLARLLKSNRIEIAKFCMGHPNNMPDKYEKFFVSYINFNEFKIKNIFKYVGRVIYNREAAKKFERLVRDFMPDIIHLHNIYHQISPSILPVAKKYNIPIVMHLHDYKLLCPNYKMYNRKGICERCRGGKYYNCIFYRCLKNSFFKSLLAALEMYIHHRLLRVYEKNIDLYIAPSEFVAAKAREWGINASRIAVLPYFIFVDEYKPRYTAGNYLLYFGRLSEEKGLDILFAAIKEIKHDVKLKIVGAGPEYKNLKAQIKNLHIEKKVEIVGPKYAEELNDIIRNSLAVIAPSKWYEVSGIVNLEAAALGKPVIASCAGGIKEVVLDKKTGYLFKTGSSQDLLEKIQKISSDINKAETYGREGRKFVACAFGPKKHFKQILKIYNKHVK